MRSPTGPLLVALGVEPDPGLMTVYAVVIAFYFGTQTQREQSATDGTQTTEEGK